jgi:uncharacterized membrane protein
MEQAFREKRYEQGTVAGIAEISDLLAAHFPSGADNADELSNKPALL